MLAPRCKSTFVADHLPSSPNSSPQTASLVASKNLQQSSLPPTSLPSPTPRLNVGCLGHSKRRREAREKLPVVLVLRAIP